MANIAIFRINYKSDFILTLESDAGWMTPFCIKFWTGAPSQAYFVGYDGTTYTHCAPVDGEPTKLRVQFDDHHLPIGDLKFQIGYHFTVADFPTAVEDEVINQAAVIIDQDGTPMQVMLDLNGETAPEIQFSLPAYANEAQRIANEEQRIAAESIRIVNEESRIAAETIRQQNEAQRIAQETARVNEFATLKSQSQAATSAANTAAALANEKAQLAADKAALAGAAATLANAKAQLAADKAAHAASAAQLANDKAALAQQKAEYAQTQGGYAKDQGDYAKDQGDYAKAQGDIAQSDHERAETDHDIAQSDHERAETDHGIAVDDHTQAGNDHTRAESDHGIAGNDHTHAESDHGIAADDHTQAGNDHTRAESDHGIAADDHTQAGNDHTRAESDHTRAESDHAAVEVYVDSLGAFDISAYHATGGVLAKYADLTAALGTNGANIPDALRKGGMSVKFVQSSDNKYVQFRYMGTMITGSPNPFIDISNWQGIDEEIVAGSHNIAESGAVAKEISGVKSDLDGNGKTIELTVIKRQANLVNYYVEAGKTYEIVINSSTASTVRYTFGVQGGNYAVCEAVESPINYTPSISGVLYIYDGSGTTGSDSDVEFSIICKDSIKSQIKSQYQYKGFVKPTDTPSLTNQASCWLAYGYGTYTNFGNLTLDYGEVALLKYNGNWSKDVITNVLAGVNFGLYSANKGYIWNNGVLSQNSGFNSTDYIPIKDDILIQCYDGGTQYTNIGVFFFDENKTLLGRFASGESTGGMRVLHIPSSSMPSGAKFFSASIDSVSSNQYRAYKPFIICGIENNLLHIDDIEDYIDNITNFQVSIDNNIGIETGKLVVSTSGNLYTPPSDASLCSYSDYIPVIPGQKYLISGKSGSGAGGAGYSSQKQFNSNLWSKDGSSIYKREIANGLEITIPNDVYYIRLSTKDNVNYPLHVEKVYTDIKSYVDDIKKEADENFSSLENFNNINEDVTGEVTVGEVIVSSTGATFEPSTNPQLASRTDYIPVKPGEKYLLSGKAATSIGGAGYNANKVYNKNLWQRNSGAEYQAEIANNLEVTIPAGVYFVRVSTMDNVNNPVSFIRHYDNIRDFALETKEEVNECKEDIKELQEEIIKKAHIIIKKISSDRFDVWVLNRNSGKYLVNQFIHNSYSYDMSQYGGSSNLLCGDMWDPRDITFENGEPARIDPNLNFIYRVDPTASGQGFENENLHVGMGGGRAGNHGCEVREWTKLLADGKDIDLDNWSGDIECSRFRIIQKSKCYAPDSSISSVNSNVYPKIVDGEPVVTAQHFLDATFEVDNYIKWRNRLLIKRDHVVFEQLHGSMLNCSYPLFNEAMINDNKISRNSFTIENGAHVVTVIGDSNALINNKYQADEVIYTGDNCSVRQRTIQDDGMKSNDIFIFAQKYGNASSGTLGFKCYIQPARTTSQDQSNPEVFNTDDIISVTNERKIEYLNL